MLKEFSALLTMVLSITWISTAAAQAEPTHGAEINCTQQLAGIYAVRRMDMGGGIMLRRNGTFLYRLAYGALDESAEGKWKCSASTVYLSSDPVEPPRFEASELKPAPKGRLVVNLTLPDGISPHYFSIFVRQADGSSDELRFSENRLTLDYSPTETPTAIQPYLSVYRLRGETIALPAGTGSEVTLRFLPNDIGKVAFSNMALKIGGDQIELERFGETLQFERIDETSE